MQKVYGEYAFKVLAPYVSYSVALMQLYLMQKWQLRTVFLEEFACA
jgi:hypothetical protein